MSFTGDLEHLPIVDVIQLLHATKKSGTLSVRGRKGESQLVFDGGYIVSANHLNDSVRIGKILVETGAITEPALTQALQDQENAGGNRKPLVAMLIERGQVKKESAFKSLEILIGLTIVEMLTWTTGTFSLDVDSLAISDEYRYFPEKLNQEFVLNTQNVLMDALRIYDEKKRDGELEAEVTTEAPVVATTAAPVAEDSWTLSAEDLGLDDLDRMERKIPGVFASLADIDPTEILRQKLRTVTPALSMEEQEELLAYLTQVSARDAADTANRPEARVLILLSPDDLLNQAVTTVCKIDGLPVFTTNDEQDIDHIIDSSLTKRITPILVFDCPVESVPAWTAEVTARVRRQKREKYPQVTIIQLTSPLDYALSLQAFAEGVRAVLPRPSRDVRQATFINDVIVFLESFRRYLQGSVAPPVTDRFDQLVKGLESLRDSKEAPDVVLALLQAVAEHFERTLALVVGPVELIAERGIGIAADKSTGVSPALGFRIPLTATSVFGRVVEQGTPHFGECDDELLQQQLFAQIGSPQNSRLLLLPMRSRGKVVALIYADSGRGDAAPVPLPLLECLASQAGLVLENVFYRKKLEKAGQ